MFWVIQSETNEMKQKEDRYRELQDQSKKLEQNLNKHREEKVSLWIKSYIIQRENCTFVIPYVFTALLMYSIRTMMTVNSL